MSKDNTDHRLSDALYDKIQVLKQKNDELEKKLKQKSWKDTDMWECWGTSATTEQGRWPDSMDKFKKWLQEYKERADR